MKLPVDAAEDTDNPEAEEEEGLKISLKVLWGLVGDAVTAALIRSENFSSSPVEKN